MLYNRWIILIAIMMIGIFWSEEQHARWAVIAALIFDFYFAPIRSLAESLKSIADYVEEHKNR